MIKAYTAFSIADRTAICVGSLTETPASASSSSSNVTNLKVLALSDTETMVLFVTTLASTSPVFTLTARR